LDRLRRIPLGRKWRQLNTSTRKGSVGFVGISQSQTRKTPNSRNEKASGKEHGTNASTSLDTLKLSVALELKLEGYTHIAFDKVIDINSTKARVHVLAEDELGLSLAVICINRPGNLDPNALLDLVSVLQRKLGEDCEVAVAIPLTLLNKAADIYGLTPRIFLVDDRLRVWIHSCRHGITDAIRYGLPSPKTMADDNIGSTQYETYAQAYNMRYIV
jgi:hypothetical protein